MRFKRSLLWPTAPTGAPSGRPRYESIAAQRGFTLLELLVAVSLLTVVTGIAAATLSGVALTQRRVESRAALTRAARGALRVLAADLRQALPTAREKDSLEQRALTVTIIDPASGQLGVAAYRVENASLIREIVITEDAALSSFVILRDVSEVAFSYLVEGRWQPSWQPRQPSPSLVRVQLVTGDPPRSYETAFRFRPATEAPSGP